MGPARPRRGDDHDGTVTAGHEAHRVGQRRGSSTPKSDRPADVVVDLTTREGKVTLASGEVVDGYTLNDSSPGPTIDGDRRTARRGAAAQRVGAGRCGPALARRRRPQRPGRRRRCHPGRGEARREVHLPVGGTARRHVLVPLPPDVARAGLARSARRDRDPPEGTGPGRRRRASGRAHLRQHPDPQWGHRLQGACASRSTGPGAGGQHRQRARRGVGERAVQRGGDRRVRRQRADRGHREGDRGIPAGGTGRPRARRAHRRVGGARRAARQGRGRLRYRRR